MPHWDFSDASKFPDLAGTIDFQVEKYPLTPEQKKELSRAFFTTGFVGQSKHHGWMFFSSGAGGRDEMRTATSHEVSTLPRLPDGWERLIRKA